LATEVATPEKIGCRKECLNVKVTGDATLVALEKWLFVQ